VNSLYNFTPLPIAKFASASFITSSAGFDFFSSREAEFPDRLLGEVVTFNHNEPKSVLIAWKNSPGHNKTILDIDYKFIGVSYAIDEFGKKYVCALLLN